MGANGGEKTASIGVQSEQANLRGDLPPGALTIPLGPKVLFTKSAIAIAPTKEACKTIKARQNHSKCSLSPR